MSDQSPSRIIVNDSPQVPTAVIQDLKPSELTKIAPKPKESHQKPKPSVPLVGARAFKMAVPSNVEAVLQTNTALPVVTRIVVNVTTSSETINNEQATSTVLKAQNENNDPLMKPLQELSRKPKKKKNEDKNQQDLEQQDQNLQPTNTLQNEQNRSQKSKDNLASQPQTTIPLAPKQSKKNEKKWVNKAAPIDSDSILSAPVNTVSENDKSVLIQLVDTNSTTATVNIPTTTVNTSSNNNNTRGKKKL